MQRTVTEELSAWYRRRGRKPLVIRGARQVGKSYLVRDFAKTRRLDLVELNFERDPKAAKLFEDGRCRAPAPRRRGLHGKATRA